MVVSLLTPSFELQLVAIGVALIVEGMANSNI